MSLVSTALKKPLSVVVLTLGLFLFSILAVISIPIDIFPKLNLPTIYVIEPYGGMSAQQMEGFFATRLQDQFLYVNGIKTISSKNIQGLTMIKLTFYESTNMAEASAQLSDSRQISFHVNALPGETFAGGISRQAGSLNDRFRSEAVEVDVQNPQHRLKPGMYAEVVIPVTGSIQALVVPGSAIVTSTEKKYVIAVRHGRTYWIDVQEGNRHTDSTEVFGSLKPGDRVILQGSDEIKEGMNIE